MFLLDVLAALKHHRVRYALVGGYAVALHGAVRGTVDVDLAISLTRSSFERTERAMNELGLESRLPVSGSEVFSYRDEYIRNRNLIAWSFVNSNEPLQMVDIIVTEDAAAIKVVIKKAFGVSIKVASIPDLIAMKKKSARPQDLEDVKALERLQ